MSSFSQWFATRAYGSLVPRLEQVIADGVDDLIAILLREAVRRWHRAGWLRASDDEIDCTVQLYRWGQEATAEVVALRVLRVGIEAVQPTPGMLTGSIRASRMKRPDLQIDVGRSARRVVECKRLSRRAPWPREYVANGISRFSVGHYAAPDGRGVMVGYIMVDAPAAIETQVNRAIAKRLGSSQMIRPRGGTIPRLSEYESSHPRPGTVDIRLDHYWIDLR